MVILEPQKMRGWHLQPKMSSYWLTRLVSAEKIVFIVYTLPLILIKHNKMKKVSLKNPAARDEPQRSQRKIFYIKKPLRSLRSQR